MSSFSCAVSRLLPLHAELCLLRAAASQRLASEPRQASTGAVSSGRGRRTSREGSSVQERSGTVIGQGGGKITKTSLQDEEKKKWVLRRSDSETSTGSMGRRKEGLKEGSSLSSRSEGLKGRGRDIGGGLRERERESPSQASTREQLVDVEAGGGAGVKEVADDLYCRHFPPTHSPTSPFF